MSGRGHSDQQPGGPLGGKIKDELLSALKLLFKSAEQHAVDLALPSALTVFVTEIDCQTESVPLNAPQPQVSEDPIQALQRRETPTRRLTLLEPTGLAQGAPCEWDAVLCSEPVFDERQFESTGVTFNNLTVTQMGTWSVSIESARAKSKPIGKIPAPPVKGMTDSKPFTTQVHNLADHVPKATIKHNPRYYALPIRKASVPPHRFSIEVRDKFRQALAEKAGTHPGNVQLKMIFERMNMGLFSAIQVDETGNLMCTPKTELLGRNAETPAGKAMFHQLSVGSEASYLVLGVRLDNKADIRALVPIESLMDISGDGKAGA
jgi:hypothetical protein